MDKIKSLGLNLAHGKNFQNFYVISPTTKKKKNK